MIVDVIVLAAMVVLLFGMCLAEAITGFALSVQRDALLELHTAASPALDQSMRQVSRFGGGFGVAVLGAAVVCGLLTGRRWWPAVAFSVAVAGASLSSLVKVLVSRPRPQLWPTAEQVSGSSFPSGHASSSAALVAALVAIAWATRWRWPVLVCGIVAVVVVGLSRVVLGAHYPSDVLGGWCLAVGWVIGVQAIARRARWLPTARRPPRNGQL